MTYEEQSAEILIRKVHMFHNKETPTVKLLGKSIVKKRSPESLSWRDMRSIPIYFDVLLYLYLLSKFRGQNFFKEKRL